MSKSKPTPGGCAKKNPPVPLVRSSAAEVILHRTDASKDRMGLTTWKDAPKGKIQKFDVVVAKNYLTENEMAQLQRLVSANLDLAEDMARRQIPMTMQDWETLHPAGGESPRLEISFPTGTELARSRKGYPAGSESLAGFSPQLSWSHYVAAPTACFKPSPGQRPGYPNRNLNPALKGRPNPCLKVGQTTRDVKKRVSGLGGEPKETKP